MPTGITIHCGPANTRRRETLVAEAPVDTDDGYEEEAAAPLAVADPDPDRDGDGLADRVDNCPDVAGPVEYAGCPPYEKVVVKPDKLEVKEKIAFRWDSMELEESSRPALDEVVVALQDNPNFRVEVGGHASSDGNDDHNQTLSEQRATTVVDYLVAHGIARDRLTSRGFSSSMPVDTNRTVEGRETNRRVEFDVHFIILRDGSTP
jgi:OOP family OmpA-OmpF porin